jgi:hypothetical protein
LLRDAPRSTRVGAVLARDAEGRRLLQAAPEHTLCWGEPETSVVDSDGRLLLDRRLADAEAAAKLGHLLQHLVEGMPLAEGCSGLEAAVVRETKAHALEARLRHTFGAPPADPAALDRVVAGYRARCSSR